MVRPQRLYHLVMRRIDLRSCEVNLEALGLRSFDEDAEVREIVDGILTSVRQVGDDALRELTKRFDGFDPFPVEVDPGLRRKALEQLDPSLRKALELAAERIETFERANLPTSAEWNDSGITVSTRHVPVERAGLYAPGGRATYPSTVLMTGIPAFVAGVSERVLCVPADREGIVPPVTLAAAELAGITRVFRIGGAQAIGAMAFGTESIPKVDVIAGPGNAYVAEAKRAVWGVVGIDSFAGPSEVVIVADRTAPARWVAADLIAQAEHGPGGTIVVVAWDSAVIEEVIAETSLLLSQSPRGDEISESLKVGGLAVCVDGPDAALAVVDFLAPEHLQLMCSESATLAEQVRNGGAIFCGNYASAPLGDYIIGVNHVLPTARTARFASSLRATTFLREHHVVNSDGAAIARLLEAGAVIADAEGLSFHGDAMRLRTGNPDASGDSI